MGSVVCRYWKVGHHVKIQDGCHTLCQDDGCVLTHKICDWEGSNLVYGLPSRCSMLLLKSRSPGQNPRWLPHTFSKRHVRDIRLTFWNSVCALHPSFFPNMATNTRSHNLLWRPPPGAYTVMCLLSIKCLFLEETLFMLYWLLLYYIYLYFRHTIHVPEEGYVL
jgi:hypothetical protein